MPIKPDPGPRIIVALDYARLSEAKQFVDRVSPAQCRLKVGLELFTAEGRAAVAYFVERGFDVFLDLKFHDIPNTVARACVQAAELGVWMMNVHALGGQRMLLAAREAIERASHQPILIAVTVLTSHTQTELQQVGIHEDAALSVQRLALLTHSCGLDGVVCSAQEARALRRVCPPPFALVTPGIRLTQDSADDQRRIATPREAIANGANYLVIGRPITASDAPDRVLTQIHQDLSTMR